MSVYGAFPYAYTSYQGWTEEILNLARPFRKVPKLISTFGLKLGTL